MSAGARAKILLHNYGLALAVLCVLIALGAGFMAFEAYTADPGTETVTDEVDVEEFGFTSHTEATVDGPNITLYEPGERLVDLPVYFHGESPTMDLILDVTGPDGTDVDVIVTAEIDATRDDRTFYSTEILLYSGQYTIEDGSVDVTAEIDVPAIRDEIAHIRQRSAGVGSLGHVVAVAIDYESDLYEGSLEDDAGITIVEQGYWLLEDPEDDARHSDTISEQIELDPDTSDAIPFAIASLLFLVIGGVIASYAIRDTDVEALRTELARSEFNEWISTGEIPTRAGKQYVKVDSLEDVVDIAIDSNKRVIHDPELDAYGVIDGDLVYYYSPGFDEIEDWLDL